MTLQHGHAVPHEHVSLALALLGEAHGAQAAWEGLLARVHQHVALEVGGLLEGGGAHGALVGPLARVDLLVAPQLVLLGEGRGAESASEHEHRVVQLVVLAALVPRREVLQAHLALERRLAGLQRQRIYGRKTRHESVLATQRINRLQKGIDTTEEQTG